jgi:hypothetical protein
MIYWDDWINTARRADLSWLAALRMTTAGGRAESLPNLNPFFNAGYDTSDIFVLTRKGSADKTGLILALNDRADTTSIGSIWIDSPFRNIWVRDYSDGFMFSARQVYSDGRVRIRVRGRDAAWFAPTGLSPKPPEENESVFQIGAEAGGCPHWVVLKASDSAGFHVGERIIRPGDQIAIAGESGVIAGVGRVGQSFEWDGLLDMVVEVLGGMPGDEGRTAGTANGMRNGERMRVVVFASDSRESFDGEPVFAEPGGALVAQTGRPSTRPDSVETVISAASAYTCLGVSRIASFSSGPHNE